MRILPPPEASGPRDKERVKEIPLVQTTRGMMAGVSKLLFPPNKVDTSACSLATSATHATTNPVAVTRKQTKCGETSTDESARNASEPQEIWGNRERGRERGRERAMYHLAQVPESVERERGDSDGREKRWVRRGGSILHWAPPIEDGQWCDCFRSKAHGVLVVYPPP